MNRRLVALALLITFASLTETYAYGQDKQKDAPPTPNQIVSPKEFEKAVSVIRTTQSQNQQKAQEVIKAVSEDAQKVEQIQKKEELTKNILDQAKDKTEEDLRRAQRRTVAPRDELIELRKAIVDFQEKVRHEAKVNTILSWALVVTGLAFGVASFVCGLKSRGTASAICTFIVGIVVAVNKNGAFDTQAHLFAALEGQAGQLRRIVLPEGLLQGQYLDANEAFGKLVAAERGADKGNIEQTLQPFANKPSPAQ